MPDTDPFTFNIPTDVYPYTGLPQPYRGQLLSTVMPKLTQAVTDYPDIIPQYMEPQMRRFKGTAMEAGQGLLNQLASRNVLGSQVSGDAMVNLMKQLNEQRFGRLADMSLQAKLQYPSMLAQIAGMGQVTEDPLAPYQMIADLLKTLY